ncbi:MAG: ABC transporter substrate-binding protein [Patescibacteria group bacterium]|nr:ABC transporter substrate-binding protein [Patescibacteria group bacterium]MDD5554258.1 ABC transporter substrate-binding protein [Patescibacteria group bacterium]
MDLRNSKISRYLEKAKIFLASFRFLSKAGNGNGFSSRQTELDKKLIYSLAKSKIPNLRQLKYLKKFLSQKERALINLCLLIIFINLFILGYNFYKDHVRLVPIAGGEYIEGLIGAPKYINPLYASASDVDSDFSQFIFSSLFRHGQNGELVKDLVTDYAVSEDGKTYTLTIREDGKWHNGEKVTTEDIVFTFNALSNLNYKSPLRLSFSGVKIEKVDEKTIKFSLTEPYAAFLELLTFGIIPENLWLPISPEAASLAELNLKPIGSGPYKFKSLTKDKNGNIRNYNLIVNNDYYGLKPKLETLTFKFFSSFEEGVSALNENSVNGLSYLPPALKDNLVSKDSLNFHKLNQPQITAVFLNQKNNPALADKKVRQALALALSKSEIVSSVFGEDAYLIDGPILPSSFAYDQEMKKYKFSPEEADKLLTEAGWIKTDLTAEEIEKAKADGESTDEKIKTEAEAKLAQGAGNWRKKDNKYLAITLTTVGTENNIKITEKIKSFWEKAGVKTNLNITPVSQIQAEVIKPKNYEALLYGQVVGNDPDVYTFWHSSQAGENGSNLANYTNKEIDQLLEDARLAQNKEQRIEKYKKFQEIMAEEAPAIFLYSPYYIYAQSKKIKGFDVKNILTPSNRFANISDWYIKTGKRLIW